MAQNGQKWSFLAIFGHFWPILPFPAQVSRTSPPKPRQLVLWALRSRLIISFTSLSRCCLFQDAGKAEIWAAIYSILRTPFLLRSKTHSENSWGGPGPPRGKIGNFPKGGPFGQKLPKIAKKWQKWPKMAKNGKKWPF